jgi:hypothetical protein
MCAQTRLFQAVLLLFLFAVPMSAAIRFSDAKTYPVGIHPYGVSTGDFNGDHITDLVVTNVGSDSVSVLLGKGDGSFVPAVSYTVGQFPQAVAVGDFNGDRKPDLAFANYGSGTLSVLIGNGDGTFEPAANLIVDQSPTSVAVADLDGDGLQDLAVASFGDPNVCNSGTVSVLLGKGDGSFQSAMDYGAGSCPRSVTAGDFNRDGHLDLVTQTSILLGNGDGTFQPAASYPTGPIPGFNVAVGDFNGDRKLDLAETYRVNPFVRGVQIVLGNGDGTFRLGAKYELLDVWAARVEVADFDRDGKVDIATTGLNLSTAGILRGNGDGTFQTSLILDVGSKPVAISISDFNGDRAPDLAVTLNSTNVIGVLLNMAGTIVALQSSNNPSHQNENVTFTVTITESVSGSGTPTGTVVLKDGSTKLGKVKLVAGQASLTTSGLGVGKHKIVAVYSGDSNFNRNKSTPMIQSVLP